MKRIITALLTIAILASLVLLVLRGQNRPAAAADWRDEWAVAEGFSIEVDSSGYDLPTAIAFVPDPGPNPQDPLYFVTELRGTVKVVSNDRTVHTFARDFFQLRPERELPAIEGEVGLAGLCLQPEMGYVFVTFAYQDTAGILRNNVVRFHATPNTFSLVAGEQMAFTEIFANHEAAISHQIGHCQATSDALYVSVADGRQTEQSQQLDSPLGKVLRLTLDGQPAAGNPFSDGEGAAPYVWAYGFRNPFGLQVVDGHVFVAENGSGIDRFVEATAGQNYLWDGSDWSIGTNAAVILSPAVGPVQVAYYPTTATLFPSEYGGRFFVALSAPTSVGVLTIPYDLAANRVTHAPEMFLRYRGEAGQVVGGVAVGPDGLYVAPILPDATGQSSILKLTYNPDEPHPFVLTSEQDPLALMRDNGCFGCHQLGGEGGTVGPALDRAELVARLEERLGSAAYGDTVAEVDQLDREPFNQYAEARQAVRQAERQEQLRLWLQYHIMEPRFDNPAAQMPNLGLTEAEAGLIADYLLYEESIGQRVRTLALSVLPAAPTPRHLLFFLLAGFAMGVIFTGLVRWSIYQLRSR